MNKALLVAAAAALSAPSVVGVILAHLNQRRCDRLFASNTLEVDHHSHARVDIISGDDLSPDELRETISMQIRMFEDYSEAEGVPFDWGSYTVDLSHDLLFGFTGVKVTSTIRAFDFSDQTYVVMAP